MATTQYIGARYVSILYTNPDNNSNDWKSGVVYDPLTVVTDINQSYTSKIPVPASVGRPSENPNYWVLTGAYNAQIEQYRQEVASMKEEVEQDIAAVQTKVDELDTRTSVNKILFIGDSYNTVHEGAGWDQEFIEQAGLSEGDYFRINVAGVGFCTTPSWTNAVQNRLSEITDKELYSSVIICSGGNDKAFSLNDHIEAMTTFRNLIKTNFPNARIYVGFLGWSGLASQHSSFRAGLNTYINACSAVGFTYLHNVEYVLHWQPYLRDNQSVTPGDYFHPTVEGLKALGDKILEAYRSGTCTVKYSALATISPAGSAGAITGDSVSVAIENNVTTITFGAQTFTLTSAVNAGSGANIGTFTCDCFNPISVFELVAFRDLTTNDIAPVNFALGNGNISIGPYKNIAANQQRTTPFILTVPTTSC